MKNFFDSAKVDEVKQRIARLRPDSPRQWGKMNAPQAVAHCSSLELALGDLRPPRVLLGRIMGPIIKPNVFGTTNRCAAIRRLWKFWLSRMSGTCQRNARVCAT
jgi:hypothetical protein